MKLNSAIFLTGFNQSMNEQKVNELYLKYKEKIYGLTISYVKDNYLTEDLSHERQSLSVIRKDLVEK